MVVEKCGKNGVFWGFLGEVPDEGLYNSYKLTKNVVFSRIQGVFSTGESIARGFET
jgi:hypothetical protein